MNNNMEATIVSSIRAIFNVDEENISSLNMMLNYIEEKRIQKRFNQVIEYGSYTKEDILSKANILNALMELVLENPSMEEIEATDRKDLLCELYKTTSSLYEQILEQSIDDIWDSMQLLVMYSMLSYLADKQTIATIVIEEYNRKLTEARFQLDNMPVIVQLEYQTYYLVISLLSNIKNHAGLILLNDNIEKAQNLLNQSQEVIMKEEEIDVREGLKISAFGNIIYLTETLKKYLFNGNIADDENQDIYSVIDVYSYNAFHLLETEDISLKLIGYLLKYAYTQVAENSIWNIAEKSPKIRSFIQNNLSQEGRYLYSLLPSQREVISDILTPKKSILVSMPTSAGKSLLAEMQILFSLHNYHTEDFEPTVCYIVPTNALIEQVKNDLSSDFYEFQFNIETTLPYYEVDEIEEEILNRKHIDILISTPEKLESLIRQGHPSITNTRLVIMDEAHNIGDSSRGSKFELVLSAVKQNMKEVNFLLLSPFISNADEIGEWLADSKRNSTVVEMEWSPTRQYIGCNILKKNNSESVLEFYKSSRNQIGTEDVEIMLTKSPLVVKEELQEDRLKSSAKLCVIINDFIKQDGNILVLCAGRGSSKNLADAITKYFVKEGLLEDLSHNKEVNKALEIIKLEAGEEDTLLQCVQYGVCYHNSGLSQLTKECIESLIREGYIKIVFTTTTLAQGMNFPINTVIFETTSFKGKGARPLTNAEFWNIAGRAGRAYKDKEGYVVVSYSSSPKKTRENVKRYIKKDLEEVISSLSVFFEGNNQISLEYESLRKPENAPILNLIQYINHILNIGYEYKISPSEMAKIRTILNDSLLYHSLGKKKGYIGAQRELNNFVTQYVRHVNQKKKEELEKADKLGISDVSFSKVKSMIGAFIMNLKSQGDAEYKASEVILKTQNSERLAQIIDIIARIPEINIEMLGHGNLDSQSIAALLLGWVNGKKVSSIAHDIRRENQTMEDAIELCNRYLNSQMKSYMPWGINIYQELSFDLESENAKMLPSYIYYGVSDKKSVLLSKLGIPRFALGNVLSILNKEHPQMEIAVENFEQMKAVVKGIKASQYQIENVPGEIIKEIVDAKVK